jgi:hypothetical protein
MISNSMGDASVSGGADFLRVVLKKTLNARSDADAHDLAERIKLVVEKNPDGMRIGTNRDRVAGDFKTDLKIELPRGLAVFGVSGPRIVLATVQGDIPLEQTGRDGDRAR